MTTGPDLTPLHQLVGTWDTEATHPALPGVVVGGSATFEWLDGERFLILRARTDHPDFPDSISVIGFTGRDRVGDQPGGLRDATGEQGLHMRYFDSRGVYRDYEADVDAGAWRLRRDAPGFSQRFTGTFADGGDTIAGRWELSRDDASWDADVRITYRRRR